MHLACDHQVAIVSQGEVEDLEAHTQEQRLAGCGAYASGHRDLPAFQIRSPLQARDPRLMYLLEPYRLPNASSTRIPNRVGLELPVLLSTRLRQVCRVVIRPNDDDVLTL